MRGLGVPVEARRRHAAGVELNVIEAGPPDGPLVILLHGFPEFWWCWRRQIAPLAEAGFRVLAPDQRGYGASEKPSGVASYDLDRLAADVTALADAHGRERVSVVGHDWGGLVAWWAATRYPERVDRLAAINAPHPAVVGPYMRRHPRQILKSAYVGLFQIPALPEAVLRAGEFARLRRAMQDTSRPGTFSDEEIDRYAGTWAEPGALTGMVNWYRALSRRPADPPGLRIVPKTLVIWGERDAFLDTGLAHASLALCEDGRYLGIPEATHWVQHEEPERVSRALVEFLGG